MAFKTFGLNTGGQLGDQDITVTAGAAPGLKSLELQVVIADFRFGSTELPKLLEAIADYLQRHPDALR